jgi:hypothetical protein
VDTAEITWDLPSVLHKHHVQEANKLMASLENDGKHLRKQRHVHTGMDTNMHFLYICSCSNHEHPPHRAGQEFLNSVFSMGLFMESSTKAVVIHVIANKDCEQYISKEKPGVKLNPAIAIVVHSLDLVIASARATVAALLASSSVDQKSAMDAFFGHATKFTPAVWLKIFAPLLPAFITIPAMVIVDCGAYCDITFCFQQQLHESFLQIHFLGITWK